MPSSRVAICQSNYIPWKGYFDLIASVDTFIIYDDVQYTSGDWRNRNRIITPKGPQWLTVPVIGNFLQPICETLISGDKWTKKHWRTLSHNYRRAPHFEEISLLLEPCYLNRKYTHLSNLNRDLIEVICEYLGIKTTILSSTDFKLLPGRSERVADLCKKVQSDVYVSGPAAKSYLDEEVFHHRDIAVEWFNYSGYPTYPQCWGYSEHSVSVVDLMYNCGQEASKYMKHVK